MKKKRKFNCRGSVNTLELWFGVQSARLFACGPQCHRQGLQCLNMPWIQTYIWRHLFPVKDLNKRPSFCLIDAWFSDIILAVQSFVHGLIYSLLLLCKLKVVLAYFFLQMRPLFQISSDTGNGCPVFLLIYLFICIISSFICKGILA